MKNLTCVILAGGLGSRLSDKTTEIPKPMIKVGKHPLLIHIINHYKKYGIKKFVICMGYKQHVIKNFFLNYSFLENDIKISDNGVKLLTSKKIDCEINLIDTGEITNTGGRIKRIEKLIKDENFFCTYGDGISDVNLKKLYKFHIKNKTIATLTAVRPYGRWGTLKIIGNNVILFREKFKQETWINGGFFVFNKKIFKYLKKNSILEQDVLVSLSKKKKLKAYKHYNFWHAVDTMKDLNYLNTNIDEKKINNS
jgi:glucose-1-phosphate cytidylyltransferase